MEQGVVQFMVSLIQFTVQEVNYGTKLEAPNDSLNLTEGSLQNQSFKKKDA